MSYKSKSILLFLLLASIFAQAQDVNIILKEASNLERQLKEPEALEKYKQAATSDPKNIAALVKCSELNCSIGAHQTDISSKTNYYNTARTFASNALALDSTSADANYVMALVSAKLTEVVPDKKQMTEYVRETKMYSD